MDRFYYDSPSSDDEYDDEYYSLDEQFTADELHNIQEIMYEMKEYLERIGYNLDTCEEDYINLFSR